MEKVPVTIIGGGVIGCAIAHELSKTIDDIVVIERNANIRGENQSSRNSGVIHSGIYSIVSQQVVFLQDIVLMKNYWMSGK